MQDVPYGFCHCGCGQKTKISPQSHTARGHVRGEPRKYLSGHCSRRTPHSYEARDCGHGTDCWVWVRHKNPSGYGKAFHNGTMRLAHVVEWERANGPTPEGLELDHLCRNPACVNPAHLESVTHTENIRRGRATRLTVADVRFIRESDENGPALARRFGVLPQAIYNVRSRATWADVA